MFINLITNLRIHHTPKIIKTLVKFIVAYRKYKQLPEAENLKLTNIFPYISDDVSTTPFDAHYFYQGVWAFEKIMKSNVEHHIDVGSEVGWAGLLSTITKVTFLDIRPFKTQLKNLTVKKGDILDMPYDNNSIDSLSCLHVLEHVGLGRYGGKLNPAGSKESCKELQRILSVNGNLYVSVPVGREITYFNACRVHSPETIIKYFNNLKLLELSGITDSGLFIRNINADILRSSGYACGLFWFTKEEMI